MTNQHPIIPPPELVQQWMTEYTETKPNCLGTEFIAARAAAWGADQQLEKDAEWLDANALFTNHLTITPAGDALRQVMRPKPPSLKEQALALLDPSNTYGSITREEEYRISIANAETIRRALETLPE
jgi:hypothetical protein